MGSTLIQVIFLSSLSLAFAEFTFIDGGIVKFKLSAVNLPTTDVDSLSDPYVSIFTGTKSPTDYFYSWTYFGSTSSKIDTQNPVWDEVFEYEPINGTYQTWRFVVRDEDTSWNPIVALDEPLGMVDINVDDYMVTMRNYEMTRINFTEPLRPYQALLRLPMAGAIRIHPVEPDVKTSPTKFTLMGCQTVAVSHKSAA